MTLAATGSLVRSEDMTWSQTIRDRGSLLSASASSATEGGAGSSKPGGNVVVALTGGPASGGAIVADLRK